MRVEMDEPLESWGEFWTPSTEDRPVKGWLVYGPERGLLLELVGDNPLGVNAGSRESWRIPIIHGNMLDGTTVTLLDSGLISHIFGSGGRGSTELRVSRAFFGAHISDLDTLKIKSYSFGLSRLEKWLGTNPFTDATLPRQGALEGVDLRYRVPAPIHVDIAQAGFSVTIGWRASRMTAMTHRNCSARIDAQALVTITATDSFTFDSAHSLAWSVQGLFALMIGEMVPVRSVALAGVRDAATEPPEYRVLYRQRARPPEDDKSGSGMFAPYPLVKEVFPSMVAKWFARNDQAKLAGEVYTQLLLQKSASLELRFLLIIQAIEAYHRSFGIGSYMDTDEFNEAIKKLYEHIPSEIKGDHRRSLENRLKYGNEYSLRKRLMQMIERVPEKLKYEISTNNPAGFVEKVVATRNYYTHFDAETKDLRFGARDSRGAGERLRILFVANLLRDLGLNDESIATAINADSGGSFWMSQPLEA